ncbi:Glycosyl phosphatidyl inositol anchor synthesis [Dissophora globulifera]|uniref:GPI ethanolamine phosphate transferase 1 n=1 Tax=Dissophora globulifera TaxID=979702 RepID=A0A9P6RNA7_9FUNG|nr:Glycosyl phosphatidyl inositol anchor synthesis [Dissophora globulifera]
MAFLPTKLTSTWLLIIGVLFHVTYIVSIFDIYFTSPLVHGMDQHRVAAPAPAKRLVLFVADGLRADKLYQLHPDPETNQMETKAPFLRHIVENEGSWGVSHTRVPTESRPGHVAIIAGFYEDVSAVTKGWQMNPVDFDSVFNQSEHTWSFGSPDILPMFAHGASDPDRIDTIMYPAEHEDYGTGNVLDTWVFEKFTALLEQSKTDEQLRKKLHSDKIVFFLHLLGLDTNGHSHLPMSEFYLNNIKIVDAGIKKVTEQLRAFYNDDKTAYVFTADHGMGNRGAHGDGHPDNTRTPIIAWGAGIHGPSKSNPQGHDEFSADWNLDAYSRHDVKQADIAPLMASLIGVNYPVNSVGELPLPYLDASEAFRAASTFTNTLQILEQYHVKQELKRRTEIFFRPFSGLTGDHSPEAVKAQVQALIDAEKYEEAEAECAVVRNLCLEGLRYLQTYDWLFLRSVVSAGYLGWIVFSLDFILRTFVNTSDARHGAFGSTRARKFSKNTASAQETRFINILAIIVFAIFAVILTAKQSPALYYAYVAFPVFFWSRALQERRELFAAISTTIRNYGLIQTLGAVLGYIIALEILVYSYFNRAILSVCFLFLALWPVALPANVQRNSFMLMVSWSVSCLGTSIFTLLPVEKGEDKLLILSGGLLLMLSGVVAVLVVPGIVAAADPQQQDAAKTAKSVMMFQVALIALSTIIVNDTVRSLAAHEGLPFLNQTLSWAILFVTGSIPFVYGARSSQHYLLRMVVIYLSFAPIFILLSISYEAIFYFFLSATLLSWLMLERKIYSASEMQPLSDSLNAEKRTMSSSSAAASSGSGSSSSSSTVSIDYPTRGLSPKDARPAVFFLFFINVAFFGTGNVASLASFSLQSVFRLTTVFDPFFMGALLIVKILIPFFLVSSIFRVLGRSLDLPPFSLFLLGLATTDVMTLNFFYLVRDDGSWLEIGTSISHFCISSLMVLFTILLFALSDLLVGRVLVPVVGEGQRKKRS